MVHSISFTLADTIYTLVLYILFASYIAKALDKLFVKMFGTSNTEKSTLQLLIECSVQVGLTASLAYPLRKLLGSLKFPSLNGYKPLSVKEMTEDATIIWSGVIISLEPSFIEKLVILKERITNFF